MALKDFVLSSEEIKEMKFKELELELKTTRYILSLSIRNNLDEYEIYELKDFLKKIKKEQRQLLK